VERDQDVTDNEAVIDIFMPRTLLKLVQTVTD
jgi:hypothetical protein